MESSSTHADVADVMETQVIAADALKADATSMERTAVADVINEMKTAVVILNWNTEGFLKKFLPGLLQSVRNVEGAEVIVADNASTDG